MSLPGSPLLRPVSYKQHLETNSQPKPSSSRSTTRKVSPKTDFLDLQFSSSSDTLNIDSPPYFISPSASEVSPRSEISFTHSDIEIMNQALMQARQCGELPCTTSSPMDAQAVVQDYGYLKRLKEARGDVKQPAPTTYKELRVEFTRRIQERDSARDEEENRNEAVRRVHHYLNSLETEKQHFEAASPRAFDRRSSSQAEIENLGEKLVSIIGQAADQTMIDALEPLCFNVHRLGAQNSEYGKLLDHQQDLIRALSAMIEPQSRAIQASGENLALLTGIVTHLSQFAMNLPLALEQIVQRAVHEQTEDAIQHVLQAHQQAVLSLLERRQEPTQGSQVINYDLLSASIVSKLQPNSCLNPEQPRVKQERGTRVGLRRLWLRVKPSVRTR